MSDAEKGAEAAGPVSGERTKGAKAPRGRPGLFTIVTVIAGVIAMSLIVWRIQKAWRIEYGSGPRGPRPIPTTGAFGAPGALPAPMRSAPPATTTASP